MRELHRIGKPGALIHISTPYFSHRNAWTDFTHVNWFTEESFGYFDRKSHLRALGTLYGIDFTFQVKVYPVDGNGTIYFDLVVEK